MGCEVEFYPKSTHLHVIVTGQNSKENVTRYLEDILRS